MSQSPQRPDRKDPEFGRKVSDAILLDGRKGKDISSGPNVNAATSQDLNQVRDIGNSILGGGTSLNVPTTPANLYPDGPDVVTIVATPLVNSSVINARISWTEAQA